MSLRAFNGSIANPAQTAVNLGGNNLSNIDTITSKNLDVIGGTAGAGAGITQVNIVGATGAVIAMYGPGATGESDKGMIQFDSVNKLFYITKPTDVLSDLKCDNFESRFSGTFGSIVAIEAGATAIAAGAPYLKMGDTGSNFGLMKFNTTNSHFDLTAYTYGEVGMGASQIDVLNGQATQTITFDGSLGTPTTVGTMSYNTSNGFKIYTYDGNNTFVFGSPGATGASTPYLRLDGVFGQSRVYDVLYNPVPTTQTYGQFSMNTTQGIGSTGGTAGVADTASQLLLDTTVINTGCTRTNGGIEVYNTGKYLITVSPQFYNTGSGNHNVYFWFRVNSTDVANSSTGIYLQGNGAQIVPTVSVVLDLTAADIVKIMAASDDSNIQALNVASQSSPYSRPAAPAIIATITRLA